MNINISHSGLSIDMKNCIVLHSNDAAVKLEKYPNFPDVFMRNGVFLGHTYKFGFWQKIKRCWLLCKLTFNFEKTYLKNFGNPL